MGRSKLVGLAALLVSICLAYGGKEPSKVNVHKDTTTATTEEEPIPPCQNENG